MNEMGKKSLTGFLRDARGNLSLIGALSLPHWPCQSAAALICHAPIGCGRN